MKQLAIIALALCLVGCKAKSELETLSDEIVAEPAAAAQPMQIPMPPDAAVAVFQGEDGSTLYLCDGYTVTVQTYEAGDLSKTLLDATGFSADSLRPMQTKQGENIRYDCVWTAAGEGEEQVGRLALIDDGNYHYVLSAMAPASQTGRLQQPWQSLFDGFALGEPISTGS